ncbi:MAG: riboflavin synthase [Victivallaceae bacterium]|nr:riboflavin synthase [Victivallaceae bacterium]
MFTGLVQTTGIIAARSANSFVVETGIPMEKPIPGESIAVNGCCLTLEKASGKKLFFHTLSETLRRTNLAKLPAGSRVHLERALAIGDRLGGHLVQGHVDAAAKVLSLKRTPDGDSELEIELPEALAPEVVVKGSIAVDGVSLTVCKAEKGCFRVRLIPETLRRTALAERVGAEVNLETDVIAKYVRHLLKPEEFSSGRPITMERLAEAGFL